MRRDFLELSWKRTGLLLVAFVFLVASYIALVAPTANAAVAYRNSASGENGAGAVTLDVPKPAGVQVGDLMIAVVSQRATNGFTHPSGWTFLSSVNTTGTLVQQQVAYRFATSADVAATTYQWTIGTSFRAAGVITAYSGVNPSGTINVSGTNTGASATTMTANALSTTVANTMVIAAFSSAVTTTFSAGSSMNLRGQATSSGGGGGTAKITVGMQDVTQAATGTTGAKTMTQGTAAVNTAHLIALTPAPPSTLEQSAYRWFSNQDTSFANTFIAAVGGTGDDKGYSIAQSADGGYLLAGYVSGYGGGLLDASIVKYDPSGNVLWRKVWGGTGDEKAQNIVVTSDGGFAVSGITTSYGAGGSDAFLLKYDASGNLSWNKTWGGTGTEYGYSVVQTSDGGYAMAGDTTSYGAGGEDLFMAKFDSSGNLSWSRVLGGTGTDYARNIKQTSDGGYILAGYTSSYGAGTANALVVKYDSAGTLSWTRTWGGSGTDYAYAVDQTLDGGYAVTGSGTSYKAAGQAATDEAYVTKLDSTGTVVWSTTWGGSSNDYSRWVSSTSDGGVIITGSESSFTGNYNSYIAKFTSAGVLSWTTAFSGAGTDNGFKVMQTGDGGYVQAIEQSSFGAGTYDMTIAKHDSTGTIANCGATCTSPTVTTTSPTVTAGVQTPTASSPSVTLGSPSATFSDYLPTHTVIAALDPPYIAVGGALAATNTVATVPASGTGFRLRMNVHVGAALLGSKQAEFKLRYAAKGASATCSVVPTGNFTDVTDVSTIRYFDNPNAGSGLTLFTSTGDPTHSTDTVILQRYREKGTTAFPNMDAIDNGQDGMWDFALTHVGATPSSNYCLKIVKSDGSDLTTYTVFPELTIPAGPVGPTLDQQLRGGQSVVNGVKSPFIW